MKTLYREYRLFFDILSSALEALSAELIRIIVINGCRPAYISRTV